MAEPDPIKRVLEQLETGEAHMGDLVSPLYAELRRMAEALMQQERRDHTLQPTALVNEAFLRCARTAPVLVSTRTEFFALAARVMRNSLVDHARARNAGKRRRTGDQVSLSGLEGDGQGDPVEVLALHEALLDLEKLDPRQAQVIELSAFGGLNGQEIADQLRVSRNTVVNDLRMGRAWLRRALDSGG